MMDWILINAVLSAMVLLFLRFQRDVPPGFRLKLAGLALFAWFIPWHLLPVPAVLATKAANLPLRLDVASTTSGEPFPWLDGSWLVTLLVAAAVVGAALFCRALQSERLLRARLLAHGTDDTLLDESRKPRLARHIPCRTQQLLPGAFTTGVVHPVIWVHQDLLDTGHLDLILTHEAMHVRRHDNASLLAIHLVESLLWWNPLVRLLVTQARVLVELSCDQACASRFAGYRESLYALMQRCLFQDYGMGAALIARVGSHASLNVLRLRSLERSYLMKVRHYLGSGAIFVCVLSVAGWTMAQPSQSERQAEYDEIMERRARGEHVELTQDQILAGMEVYAKNLEEAYSRLNAEKARLEQQVAELQQRIDALDQIER